jgi:hypothetical protein
MNKHYKSGKTNPIIPNLYRRISVLVLSNGKLINYPPKCVFRVFVPLWWKIIVALNIYLARLQTAVIVSTFLAAPYSM